MSQENPIIEVCPKKLDALAVLDVWFANETQLEPNETKDAMVQKFFGLKPTESNRPGDGHSIQILQLLIRTKGLDLQSMEFMDYLALDKLRDQYPRIRLATMGAPTTVPSECLQEIAEYILISSDYHHDVIDWIRKPVTKNKFARMSAKDWVTMIDESDLGEVQRRLTSVMGDFGPPCEDSVLYITLVAEFLEAIVKGENPYLKKSPIGLNFHVGVDPSRGSFLRPSPQLAWVTGGSIALRNIFGEEIAYDLYNVKSLAACLRALLIMHE